MSRQVRMALAGIAFAAFVAGALYFMGWWAMNPDFHISPDSCQAPTPTPESETER